MVESIRKDTISYQSQERINGLFVVGKPNSSRVDIPKLPSLWPSEDFNKSGNVIVDTDIEESKYKISCPELLKNYSNGDIVFLDNKAGVARSILSVKSNANTLLLTEQCDNRCIFCSQPPNEYPDTELYINATVALLNYNSSDYVGLSGGEPTINQLAFAKLLETLNTFENKTKLHILSNGRNFSDNKFAENIGKLIGLRETLWGIPLYGHKSSLHDCLVNSKGAFNDTVSGLSNMEANGQIIELRIVPTTKNINYIPNILSFVASSYSNIKIVSIMNVEPKGWARKNYTSIYVPIKNQVASLLKSIDVSVQHGIDVRLFNYPICLLSEELRSYAVKSISDWKNYYSGECDICTEKNNCGGFFTSATGNFIEKIEAIL